MENSQKFVNKISQPNICNKCDVYWQKKLLRVSEKVEIRHTSKGSRKKNVFFTVKICQLILKKSQHPDHKGGGELGQPLRPA